MGLGISIRLNGLADETVGGAASVEVLERVGHPTSYRLQYPLDIGDSTLPLLEDARLGPGADISILVPMPEGTQCLVKGPVYGQHIHVAHGGASSTLDVLGADSLVLLDREDKVAVWRQRDSDAVSAVLGSRFGNIDVETTVGDHSEDAHVLLQRESDLAFLRRMARRNGCFLWVSCDADGAETAHFRRPVLEGSAAADLVINLKEPQANLDSLDITWDVQRPTSTHAAQLNLGSRSILGGAVGSSPQVALGGSPLSRIADGPRLAHVHAPVDDDGTLVARSEALLIESSFFLKATGATTAHALGSLLRVHSLVRLRGAGARHDGLWYCSSVRHAIDVAEHRMEFELIRNGWRE